MKQFFWRLAICILPCILAAVVTTDATMKYYAGDPGGFKLGVDLVGGTILVYEIDLRKNTPGEGEGKFDPVKDINVLAESLKRRIDPNDLYNITIRPAGGEGRIEIILPTGGTHRARRAEENWRKLVAALEEQYVRPTGSKRTIEVGRGKNLELAEQIQVIQSETRWQKQLFSDEKGWARLIDSALKNWPKIDNDMADEKARKEAKKSSDDGPTTKRFNALKRGEMKALEEFVLSSLLRTQYATTPKVFQLWLKKQAWDETMTRIREKWLVKEWDEKTSYQPGDYARLGADSFLNLAKDNKVRPGTADDKNWRKLDPDPDKDDPPYKDMERIIPDRVDQLTTFVLTKGAIIGQATLQLLDPLVGQNIERVFQDGPTAKEVRDFIMEHYGPPVQKITEEINDYMKKQNLSKDTSVEDVQRIKDLVSKVGSLEFRILANSQDDTKGIADAKGLIDQAAKNQNSEDAKALLEAQEKGQPPPGPRERDPGTKQFVQKIYEITTARSSKSRVTYSWVELGPEERKALNLDNAARTDSTRNTAWHGAAGLRNRNLAGPLPVTAGSTEQFLLQGALFYSRDCKDRNLPEEERRKKEVEYFILTRDPEFREDVPSMRTKKIDGSFLQNAYGAPGQDLRPTVHFVFNAEGGDLFGAITRKNVSEGTGPENTRRYRHLAVILDGMVMSAPTINSEIRTQGQISSPSFTQKQVDSQVNILRAGRLPATLKPQPVSESTIAATLGEDTIASGVNAIVLGFMVVLVLMIIYYRFAGLVASIALLANLLLTVGFMVAVQATFTLSGLAGLVLTVGMAVDANVLIYERLREERERGASLLQAIRNGYDRALPTILDTHVTTILTGVILYIVGNDNLKGFAVSMIVGLVFSLFTAIVITRLIFDIALAQGWLTKLTMMKLLSKTDFDFMGIRYAMFGITVGAAVIGLALFIGRIPNDLSIDFVGGTAYGGKLIKGVTAGEIRGYVSDANQKIRLKDVQVSEIAGSDGRRYELMFPHGDKQTHTVSFSTPPEGATMEERVAIVKKRAAQLQDPTADLLFNSTNDPAIIAEIKDNRSRNFMVRTMEREPELVQTCLDQLLRDGDTPLLGKIHAIAENQGKLDANKDIRLRFYSEIPANPNKPDDKKTEAEKNAEKPATASQSFVKSLFNREMRRSFALPDEKAPLPYVFEVIPEGKDDVDGKYSVLKISFGADIEIKDVDMRKIEAALENTVRAFAARPLPDRLENFDSALANETRLRALWAVLASWAGILLYLWFRFGSWTFGLAAVTCVMHDIFITLGIIAACYFVHDTFIGTIFMLEDFKLDLTAIASLLTLVGYSVNDKIVVFDRIREVRGKNPDLTPKMINDSINQTLSRTVLTSTTIAAVFLLYVIGGPGLHLFAFIMLLGVIIGTYSSVYIAAPLLLIFGEGRPDEGHPASVKPAAPTPEGAVV